MIKTDDVKRLTQAVRDGDVATVNALLAQEPHLARCLGSAGPALCVAVVCGEQACFEALLPYSVPNQGNPSGETALMLAALHNRPAMVTALLPVTDPNLACNAGYTPLMKAAEQGHAHLLDPWLTGEHVQRISRRGWSALMLACENNRPDGVARLIPFSDPDQANDQGRTALRIAVEMSYMECLDHLATHQDPRPMLASYDFDGLEASAERLRQHAVAWERRDLETVIQAPAGTAAAGAPRMPALERPRL